MSEDNADKTIAKFTFSGKKVDWPVWSEKFLARARRKDYKKVIVGTANVPSDSVTIDSSTAIGKEQKRLRELNELAYEDLILFIDGTTDAGRVAFSIVRGSKSNELKDGDACLAWKRLNDKYESKSAPSRLKLKKEFNNSKLQNLKEDPDVWLTKLEDLRVQLVRVNAPMTDEDLMEHVLNNLPDAYENVITKLEDKIGDANDPLTISKLRDELNLKFERLNGKRTIDNNSNNGQDGETALFAGGFKGKCNRCGRWGHKARDCRSGGNNNNNNNNGNQNRNQNNNRNESRNGNRKFQGKCNYCNKVGHKEADCWKKQRDERQNDQANSAVETGEEMVLMAFEKGYCCEIPKHKKKDCVAAEVAQADNEEEGPVNDWKLKTVYTHELDYDCFYLGLKRYEYDCIPNSIGIKPEDPSKSLSFGEQYDKPDGWSTTMRNYELKLREWKVLNFG